jgi:hypothetical protein
VTRTAIRRPGRAKLAAACQSRVPTVPVARDPLRSPAPGPAVPGPVPPRRPGKKSIGLWLYSGTVSPRCQLAAPPAGLEVSATGQPTRMRIPARAARGRTFKFKFAAAAAGPSCWDTGTARDRIPKRCWNLTASPGPRAGASEPGPTWSVTTGLRLRRLRNARGSTLVTASVALITWAGHAPPLHSHLPVAATRTPSS